MRIGPGAWGPFSLTSATDGLKGCEYVCKLVRREGLEDVFIDLGGAQHLTYDFFYVPARYAHGMKHDLDVFGLLVARVVHGRGRGHKCRSTARERKPVLAFSIRWVTDFQHWRVSGSRRIWDCYL